MISESQSLFCGNGCASKFLPPERLWRERGCRETEPSIARPAECVRQAAGTEWASRPYHQLTAGRQGRAPDPRSSSEVGFTIACGHADCNDAARLTEDSMHKVLLGRDPLKGTGTAPAAGIISVRECAASNGSVSDGGKCWLSVRASVIVGSSRAERGASY